MRAAKLLSSRVFGLLVLAFAPGVAGAEEAVVPGGVDVSPTCPRFAPPRLPEARGDVPYETKLFEGAGVSTEVVPGFFGDRLPTGLQLAGNVLRGTPSRPGAFTFAIKYVIAERDCPGFKYESSDPRRYSSTYEYTLIVHDLVAPQLQSFTVTPAKLGTEGGRVVVTVRASDNVGVVKVTLTTVRPDRKVTTATIPLVKGEWTMPVYLPANLATASATYRFSVAVGDLDLNETKAGPIAVTVTGRPAATRLTPPGG